MAKLINKVLFKYIMLLMLVFIGSIGLVILTHLFFENLGKNFEQKSQNLKAKIEISRYLLEDITFIHLHLLELTAISKNDKERDAMIEKIENKVTQAEGRLYIIHYGGSLQKAISLENKPYSIMTYTREDSKLTILPESSALESQFDALPSLIKTLSSLLRQRDKAMMEEHAFPQEAAAEIKIFNLELSRTFEELKSMMTNLILKDSQNLYHLENESIRQKNIYLTYEFLLIFLTIIIVLFLLYKIILHITNLYKELEHQLYIDPMTKLKNRFALLKDLKEVQNPAIIIIDINTFRTINELYGVHVGNEVLIIFSNILKHFAKNRDFKVYRISGDEFVFFQDALHVNIEKTITLLDAFFAVMEDKKIFVPQIDDTIYLDLSAGISFEKNNTLGTADIALNKAKELHKQFVFYHSSLDSIQAIKQGALWKKRIIQGIEDDLFIPFFQPIVDREEKVVKYEALMRLKEEKEGVISYVLPFEFLDIASKTRHYDQISQMTLLKSLHICATQDMPITVNLNYHDILNKPLHIMLKKAIIAEDIGKKLIFEILESENIQSYKVLKNFMAQFREYGVRFAIDDFGTGFSNFSHIFELSPDFIKIDGSLIKNIHVDKKSYELVKAIVFFSQELGIKTIAEFVHSKEVFEIAYKLGIDQFQGYYFSEPKEKI
ncbi:MAG: bifunctional diguanylate cyclase/phosphodiesterase [Campylobacteraceae bacterium]|nr:bifunctional diguanylate cyclase/phosphodiesterase [Campylobacteraceae bacterium]